MSPALVAHLDCFYNDMDDLITKRVSVATLTFDNTSDAWSAGIEAGVDWEAVPGLLSVSVNYTGQQTEDGEFGEDRPKTEYFRGSRLVLAEAFLLQEEGDNNQPS